MLPDCMILGKLSWVIACPWLKASSSPWLVAPMAAPRASHLIFLVVLVPVKDKPGSDLTVKGDVPMGLRRGRKGAGRQVGASLGQAVSERCEMRLWGKETSSSHTPR